MGISKNTLLKVLRFLVNFPGPPSSGVPAGKQPILKSPAAPTPPLPRVPDSGHVERKTFRIQEIDPNTTIEDSEESWCRYGDIMEGDTLETLAVTASGELANSKALKIVCSVCNKVDDISIRSDVSHRPLCRICQRKLTLPDGTILTLTPQEYSERVDEYNTWKAFDAKQELPRR